MNEQTRQQLENILANLKLKTGIEFDVATVQSTGARIFPGSRCSSRRIGTLAPAPACEKSLLLVLAVDEKMSFTRFSKSVQNDLPEGVLGEVGQRMRSAN